MIPEPVKVRVVARGVGDQGVAFGAPPIGILGRRWACRRRQGSRPSGALRRALQPQPEARGTSTGSRRAKGVTRRRPEVDLTAMGRPSRGGAGMLPTRARSGGFATPGTDFLRKVWG